MATIENKDPQKPEKVGSGKDAYVKRWKRRLDLAEKKLKNHGGDVKQGGWKKLLDFHAGNQWPTAPSGSAGRFHRVTSNQAKSNIDAIRPQLYFQNPKVRIRVKNPAIQEGKAIATIGGQPVDANLQARLFESIDNYYMEECRAKNIFKRTINDALILPYGVSKWEWVIEERETPVVKVNEETGEEDLKYEVQETNQYPRLSRIAPWQFIWDYRLEEFDLDLARWVAEIKYMSKDEIESDPLMSIDLDDIAASDTYSDEDESVPSGQDLQEEARLYKVYEVHDLENDELLVWVQGSEKMARHDTPSPYSNVEGGIYTVLGFDEVPNDSFPLPILEQIRPLSEAYNFMLSYQVNHAARFNRKYYLQKQSLSAEEKEKLEIGADGTIIEGDGPAGQPIPIQDAPMSVDIYNVSKVLKTEQTEAIGVTAYGKGGHEPGVDTAYEANLISSGSDIKIQEKRDCVVEFIKRNIKKLNQILKTYADVPQIQEITGPEGSQWIQWTKADIQGEFLEDVDIYQSLPYARDIEKKQAMELASIATGNPHVNQNRLWQKVFGAFEWGDEILNTPEEMQEAMQRQAEQQAIEEQKRQQGQTMRPGTGGPQRSSDMQGEMLGGAKKGRVA